jgi:hypothetical protein
MRTDEMPKAYPNLNLSSNDESRSAWFSFGLLYEGLKLIGGLD